MEKVEPEYQNLFEVLLEAADECRRRQTLYRLPRNAVNRKLVEEAEAKLDELLTLHRLPELPTASSSSATAGPAPEGG